MGLFDDLFEEITTDVIALFRDAPVTLTLITPTYDPLTGSTTNDTKTVDVPCSPPAAFTRGEIDNVNILSSDLRISVASAALLAADFPTSQTNGSLTATLDSTTYRVMRVTPVFSGDRAAYLKLQLRQ